MKQPLTMIPYLLIISAMTASLWASCPNETVDRTGVCRTVTKVCSQIRRKNNINCGTPDDPVYPITARAQRVETPVPGPFSSKFQRGKRSELKKGRGLLCVSDCFCEITNEVNPCNRRCVGSNDPKRCQKSAGAVYTSKNCAKG